MRMKIEARKEQLLNSALKLAEEHGYQSVTRKMIAENCDCTEGNVSRALGATMPQIKRDIMRHAVKSENLAVIAQGIVNKDSHALKADIDLRTRALAALVDRN